MAKLDEVLKAIPEFIKKLEEAKSESAIAKACQQMKDTVDQIFNRTEGRRDPKSMAEIRKAVEDLFPPKPTDGETKANFPYYYASNKVGKIKRLEHLALKHLVDERNTKTKTPCVEPSQETIEVKPVITTDVSIESFGLSEEELVAVNHAVGDADVKEWVKQAIMQRANAINKLRESLDEDWASIPSGVLMDDKKYRTNSGACRELVNRAVRVIKQWNYDHPEHKWCLTNKLISELTGITVKAIAKAVEGMDNESYNKGQGLEPVINRLTRAAVGEPKEVMSVSKVTGSQGSEVNYHPEKAISS
jgi:hypothetical protein